MLKRILILIPLVAILPSYIFGEFYGGIKLGYSYVNVDNLTFHVPQHPDDYRFFPPGGTDTKLNIGNLFYFSVEFSHSLPIDLDFKESLGFDMGIFDVGIFFDVLAGDLRENPRQTLDPRPKGSEARVFSEMNPILKFGGLFSLRVPIEESEEFFLRLGTKFSVDFAWYAAGHDRFNKDDPIYDKTCTGYGIHPFISILKNNSMELGLSYDLSKLNFHTETLDRSELTGFTIWIGYTWTYGQGGDE